MRHQHLALSSQHSAHNKARVDRGVDHNNDTGCNRQGVDFDVI